MVEPRRLPTMSETKGESYFPLPHQIKFQQNAAKYRAMVSGMGAGKTKMGVREVMKWSQLYPGSFGVIGRLTSKSLKNTTQKRFFEICPSSLIAKWRETDGHLWLYTPIPGVYSEILFMHLDEPGPLGSLDISYFWIDEAHEPEGTEVPEEVFRMLQGRVDRHAIGPHRGIVTTNPGGRDWVWSWFFDDDRDVEKQADFWGIVAKTRDNPFLPADYESRLRRNNANNPAWVARFLDGSFDAFEGQMYPEYDSNVHEYDPLTVTPSTHWRADAGFDFGISAPTAVLLARIDPDGGLWIYDEYHKPESDIRNVALWMKTRGHRVAYADPAVQHRVDLKNSPQSMYAEEGITLILANNDQVSRALLMHTLLHRSLLHINKRNCPNLIGQIKQAQKDENSAVEKRASGKPDHALDALEYLAMEVYAGGRLLDAVDPRAASKEDVMEARALQANRHPSEIEDEEKEREAKGDPFAQYDFDVPEGMYP